MNLLLLPAAYPNAAHLFGGVFYERCADALRPLCTGLEVLVPRPYTPALVAGLNPRWAAYARIPPYETRAGISVWRPRYLQIPRLGAALWPDVGAYVCIRATARALHRRARFDALLSFDLISTGGLAWRLGRDLGIPAAGWATGGDVRVARTSAFGHALRRTVGNLRLVFYQSQELRNEVARVLDILPGELDPARHIVLAHGIPEPPDFRGIETRRRIRKELGVGEEQILLLTTGRILLSKGILELVDALAIAVQKDARITALLLGAMPGFDDQQAVDAKLSEMPVLRHRVRILPACDPTSVWDYLCAADIFVFTSHREGMPNSLLESMAMAVPSIAFAIPPVKEIEGGQVASCWCLLSTRGASPRRL